MCDIFGGGGGGGKNTTSVSTSTPWKPVADVLQKTAIPDLTNLYKSGGLMFDYFPQSTVAPLAPERSEAWSMIADRARTGSPLTAASKGYFSDVLGGKYLNADAPGMDAVLRKARDSVNANYALGGRYGSGAHDAAVTEATAPLIYDNYMRERALMDEAARIAPSIAQTDYFDAQQLGRVGEDRQAYAQDLTNDEVARFNWDEKKKFNALQLLMGMLSGTGGGQTVATAPAPANNSSSLLDFLGTAIQAGSAFARA